MVTPDGEDKRILKDLAAILGTTNSKKWDLVDLKKKNAWMISTLSALSEDQEAKEAIGGGPRNGRSGPGPTNSATPVGHVLAVSSEGVGGSRVLPRYTNAAPQKNRPTKCHLPREEAEHDMSVRAVAVSSGVSGCCGGIDVAFDTRLIALHRPRPPPNISRSDFVRRFGRALSCRRT